VFSYRSLLTFKLMKEAPIAYREARKILQAMIPNFAILGIHHEDRPSPAKFCVLHRGEPDRLEVHYGQAAAETEMQQADERCCSASSGLGCIEEDHPPRPRLEACTGGTFPIVPRQRRSRATGEPASRDARGVPATAIFPWLRRRAHLQHHGERGPGQDAAHSCRPAPRHSFLLALFATRSRHLWLRGLILGRRAGIRVSACW
jgi:hypothetical protein